MNIDITIITFHRDAEFLKHCLASIHKFVRGHRRIIAIYPNRDKGTLDQIVRGKAVPHTYDEIEGHGFNQHQALQCSLDTISDATHFLHVDADCFFHNELNVQKEYFDGGKPRLAMQRYDDLAAQGHADVCRWREGIFNATGFAPEYEYMRRFPIPHVRAVYQKARSWVESHKGRPFLEWAIDGQDHFPQFWSEFNLLGTVAHKFFADRYNLIDLDRADWGKSQKMVQFWSHGGLDKVKSEEPFIGRTPRDVIRHTMGITL